MNQNGKPDFSNVDGGGTPSLTGGAVAPDFSNVQGGARSTEASAHGEQTYTVASGDTLSHIAKQFYGKPDWKPIFEANRDQLDNPDLIRPGQVLRIPAAS